MKRQKPSPGQISLLPMVRQGRCAPLSWETRQKMSGRKLEKPMKGKAIKGVRNHLAIGYRFIAPNGQSYIVGRNIRQFCRLHGLYYRAILDVWHGRTNHHKGWMSAKSRDRLSLSSKGNKAYQFVSPSGEIFEGVNIQRFAKEHQLTPQLLQLVARGKRHHHKGWRLVPKKESIA